MTHKLNHTGNVAVSTDRHWMVVTDNHPWNAERLTFNPPVDALYVLNENGVVHTAWNPLARR